MNIRAAALAPGQWTGTLTLDLRNARDWSVGDAELSLRRDTVLVQHANRHVAIFDRDVLCDWLHHSEPAPWHVDDLIWSAELGSTYLQITTATSRRLPPSGPLFRVTPESLANLVSVI